MATDQRRRLEALVALTRRAIEAARSGDVEALGELDGQRREVISRLRGAGTDPALASLALEARTLDRRLAEAAVAARDALGARVRDLHAVGRAQRGYALTESLGTGARRA